jgi:putative effector of murein hydrolase
MRALRPPIDLTSFAQTGLILLVVAGEAAGGVALAMDEPLRLSLLPRSTSTPLAMEVSRSSGGVRHWHGACPAGGAG